MATTTGILSAAKALRLALSGFEPDTSSGKECALLAEELALTEKACTTGRLRAAVRAVDCGAHKEAGLADPVAWLSRQGGTTASEARAALGLARNLEEDSDMKEALVTGAVSFAQAQEIAKVDTVRRDEVHELLELAAHADLTTLRDETRERRLAASRPEELHLAQMAARRFRHWRDGAG
ncbi:MAG TPA: hypothetical protein VMD28_04730, partial [Acidimicrobiales bacterium]|nr:hypothetical protein [Acidimicrobiales bacterium]